MASGTGNLPNQNKVFTPFDILTAEELNELVANIESLADGSGIGDRAIKGINTDLSSFSSDPEWDSGWVPVDGGSGMTSTALVRRFGTRVTVTGQIAKNSGSFNGGDILGTLPVGFRPEYTMFHSAPMSASNTSKVEFNLNGQLTISGAPGGGAANYVRLDGFTYFVA